MKTEKIKNLLSEISPWPWSYDQDENEIHSDVMQEFGGDPKHICELLGGNKIANAFLISAAPEIIDQLLRQNEIMRNALVELDGCYIPLTAEYVSKKALKKCDEIEVEND